MLEAADARQSFEALHDPNKGRGGEGTVYKKFKCAAAALLCTLLVGIAVLQLQTDVHPAWDGPSHPPRSTAAALGARLLASRSMRPAPDKGWFFSIASTASGSQVNISCNVSDAELRLVTRVFDVSWQTGC